MQVEIFTPDKKVYEGEADSVRFPGSEGDFQVLRNHAPLIGILGRGDIRLKRGGQETRYRIDGGVVEVLRNRVIVLAEKIVTD